MATLSRVQKFCHGYLKFPARYRGISVMSKMSLSGNKKFTINRYMERLRSEDLLNDVAPNFEFFGTLFKELFQNVEVEDEQLLSIDK